MRVLIFGLGVLGGGFSAASYFLDRGHEVRVTDLRSEHTLGGPLEILKKRGATVTCGEHRTDDFDWADLVIKNPAVPPDSPYLKHAKQVGTDISYIFASPIINSIKIIAVTGTKGKTTTVAVITHILNAMGHEAVQFGNMGISGFSVLSSFEQRLHEGKRLPEYLICELSSWQIRDLYSVLGKQVPTFKIVALTSLFHDHLNRYSDYAAYKEDKWLLVGSDNPRIIIPESIVDDLIQATGTKHKGLKTVESFSGALQQDPRYRVAWAACRSLGLGSKQISGALATFRGVPHRQEQVGMKDHVVFINDSSATIPEAVTFSCLYLPWPFHLICGGTDKNLNPDGMLHALQQASGIHLLKGSFTTNKLIPLLEREHIPFNGPFSSMQEAFDSAHVAAREALALHETVAVILSPGASSFGLFMHEFDRGDQFREIVESL